MSESYRALLGRPAVLPLLGALSAAWLSFGMVGLAVILTAHGATGSYSSAGAVMAAFAFGASMLAPVRGRIIDRHGARPWLVLFAAGFGGSLLLLAGLASSGTGTWPLIACAGAAGISAPPLVATLRGLWSQVVEEAALRRAYTLTALIGDVGMVAAPALCGLLFVLAPWSPLVVCALSPMLGAVIVARRAPSASSRGSSRGSEPPLLGSGRMRRLLVVSVALGAALGLVEIAVPASASRWGIERYSGLMLASFALGSVAGGLWFGRRRWRRSAQERYLLAAVCLALALAPLALATTPKALAALLFIAGLGYGPATISLFEALDVITRSRSTEALTWVTTAEAAGIATGAAASGWIVSSLGSRAPFGVASLTLAVAAVGALLFGRGKADAR